MCRTYIQKDARQKNEGKISTEETFTVKRNKFA